MDLIVEIMSYVYMGLFVVIFCICYVFVFSNLIVFVNVCEEIDVDKLFFVVDDYFVEFCFYVYVFLFLQYGYLLYIFFILYQDFKKLFYFNVLCIWMFDDILFCFFIIIFDFFFVGLMLWIVFCYYQFDMFYINECYYDEEVYNCEIVGFLIWIIVGRVSVVDM